MIWRIANRIAWVHSGRAWADYPDFDMITDPSLRAAGLAPGVAPAQPHAVSVHNADGGSRSPLLVTLFLSPCVLDLPSAAVALPCSVCSG